MQEPRAVAERRGDLESVAELAAGGRQASIVLRRRRQVRHEGEIVARSNRGQESVELGGRDGGRWGLMAGEHVLRVLLALGDVGLVERIDLQNRPRDGGCELPAEKLLPEIVSVLERKQDLWDSVCHEWLK